MALKLCSIQVSTFVVSFLFLMTGCNQPVINSEVSGVMDVAEDSLRNTIVKESFDQYCNSRFGFCIDYPVNIFKMQPESQNGDGRVFKDFKDSVILTVWGRRNEDPDGDEISLSAQMSDDLKEIGADGSSITYKKKGKKFYIISGLKNKKVFYRKTILIDGAFAFAVMEYQQSDTAIYNPLIASVAASFK